MLFSILRDAMFGFRDFVSINKRAERVTA